MRKPGLSSENPQEGNPAEGRSSEYGRDRAGEDPGPLASAGKSEPEVVTKGDAPETAMSRLLASSPVVLGGLLVKFTPKAALAVTPQWPDDPTS